jgi:hypothetical protein
VLYPVANNPGKVPGKIAQNTSDVIACLSGKIHRLLRCFGGFFNGVGTVGVDWSD